MNRKKLTLNDETNKTLLLRKFETINSSTYIANFESAPKPSLIDFDETKK